MSTASQGLFRPVGKYRIRALHSPCECYQNLMSTARPRITAIMANYNHSQFITHALADLAQQTMPFDEILILDDASTDNSIEVIQATIKDIPYARLIQNPQNMGVVATLNRATPLATGDFIFYLSADDRYDRQIVERCQEALALYPDVAMISGNAVINNVDTGEKRTFLLPFPQQMARYTWEEMAATARKRAFTFYGGANVIRRDAILAAGSQIPELKWNSDWLLYLLIAYRHPFAVIPQTLVEIRQTADQYSFASFVWKKQKPVIQTFIRTLQQHYPAEYPYFRSHAILPSYDLEALPLLLSRRDLRAYLTPMLIWRLLTYKALRGIGRLLPESLRPTLRKLLHV